MTNKAGVALIALNAPVAEHDAAMQQLLGERIAGLLDIPFLGWQRPDTQRDCYWLPDETLMGDACRVELGVQAVEDFFGGAVAHPYMATKAISHPLPGNPQRVPEEWCAAFHPQVASAVLRGYTVFDLDDARQAAMAMLDAGPVRFKAVRGKAGRGQWLVTDEASLAACLAVQDGDEVARWGLVIEEHLQDVQTFSVGQVTVAGITASYFGVQRLTRDATQHEVYGGSQLTLVRGGFEALQALPLGDAARQAIRQAQCYDQAAFACFGLIASRRNYDIAQGLGADGQPRSGVLEQSWRLGGASAAELFAVQALQRDPQLQRLRASTHESYGEDAPAGAQLLQRCRLQPHGTLSRYVKVEVDACPQ
ncbi:DUF3182 family protein [Pseudomonas sp. D1-3]